MAVETDAAGRGNFNAIFGDKVVSARDADILVQFQYNIATDDVTTATSGTGAASVASATATLTTGASTGAASLTSVDVIRYQPGFDGYAYFTAAFSGSDAGSVARIGVFDANDGMFLEHSGGVAYAVKRSGASDEKIAIVKPFKAADLDFTQINIYRISYGWLGVAPIAFEVYSGLVDGWVALHAFEMLNKQTVPSITQPSLPITASVDRTSGSGAITLKTCSWSAGRIGSGGVLSSDRAFGSSNSKASVSTETAILTIKNAATFQSRTNRVVIEVDVVSFACDGTKTTTFNLKKNATLGGSPSYANVNANSSVASVDTAGTTVTGGTSILPIQLAKVDAKFIPSADLRIKVRPGETLTISASSASASDVVASIRWRELF
jgi:hypothetical protein